MLILEEAGGKVTDVFGKELDFSLGRRLTSNEGVVVAHPNIHSQVIDAIQKVLGNKVK